jgi:hypothetical protein
MPTNAMQMVSDAKQRVENLSVDDVSGELERGALLVDLRESEERTEHGAIPGVALLPFAASLAYLATRAEPSVRGTQVVIAGNVLWVAASILLLASGPVSPTPLGTAFVLAQAAVVALLTALERASLRRVRMGFAT